MAHTMEYHTYHHTWNQPRKLDIIYYLFYLVKQTLLSPSIRTPYLHYQDTPNLTPQLADFFLFYSIYLAYVLTT